MDNNKIVEELLTAIEKNNFTKAESLLTKDFRLVGVAPDPLNAQEFLGFHKALNQGLPDFSFNYKVTDVKDNVVYGTVRLSGTNTRDIPELIPGTHTITATQKTVKMPQENCIITLKGDKISELNVQPVPGGGITGLFKQLGVEVPELHHH